jgi:hypothetical protein
VVTGATLLILGAPHSSVSVGLLVTPDVAVASIQGVF